jgi:hypothetical protein
MRVQGEKDEDRSAKEEGQRGAHKLERGINGVQGIKSFEGNARKKRKKQVHARGKGHLHRGEVKQMHLLHQILGHLGGGSQVQQCLGCTYHRSNNGIQISTGTQSDLKLGLVTTRRFLFVLAAGAVR